MKNNLIRNKNGKAQRITEVKFAIVLVIISLFSIDAKGFSQNPQISLDHNQIEIGELFNEIEQKTDMHFLYNVEDVDLKKEVSIHVKNEKLSEVLEQVLTDVALTYKIRNDQVVLFPMDKEKGEKEKQNKPANTAVQDTIKIMGKIKDADGQPISGASVVVLEENRGVVTDFDGNYIITVEPRGTLEFRCMGFESKEFVIEDKFSGGTLEMDVDLEVSVSELSGVVLTGIVNRDRETFTGAVNTIEGEELKAIGNQNIIQSLKTLDPSMVVMEDNELGSDPNALPDIEIRGKTSVPSNALQEEFEADPNTPLFILDGFETDLQTVVDLDMNRVEEISILKDAASTALYGAKAANGVVVIETMKPEMGEMKFRYTGDFMVQFADLTDYNLMNAEEKIEYEKLAGRWSHSVDDPRNQYREDSLYNKYVAEVARGVNTYWLSQPIQTVFTQKHSIYTEGGNEHLQFGAGLDMGNSPGVMKGSKRDTYGANLDLTYRKSSVNISNRLYINGAEGVDSPHGSFSEFARANPYYRMEDEDGNITKYLDEVDVQGVTSYDMINPLYSSTLNNKSITKDFQAQNNLSAIWDINSHFRLTGGVQVRKGFNKQETFVSPQSPEFDEVNFDEKGSYNDGKTENFSYNANLMLNYSRVFNNIQSLTLNLRTDVEETNNSIATTRAVGFPVGSNGNPNFAFQYPPNASPAYSTKKFRRNNLLASLNYAYDQKYLIDATYRLDGSTAFGSDKSYSSFWSVGVGWNIHNEFDLSDKGINTLKLRTNMGSTGNQNFGSMVTTSVYNFNSKTNLFGQGIGLESMANENLDWQKTVQANVGLDLGVLDDKLSASLEIYQKYTKPLVIQVDLPSSSGVKSYPMNLGNLKTQGAEAILKYSPIYSLSEQIVWTIGATTGLYSSKYNGFDYIIDNLNDAELANRTLMRYRDGYSPDALWAVPSLGIDPATGREVFLKKNGQTTYDHDYEDENVVGNATPDIEGVLSSNLRYKDFSLGLNFRYRLGVDKFNNALYEKVENIGRGEIAYNQDRRALEDRWKEPGDISSFKGISITEHTPQSSRFVQKENVLIGESIRLGYDAKNKEWLDSIGLERLSFNAYMNDIFRVSSIKIERGTSYPFARSVSFSINAAF